MSGAGTLGLEDSEEAEDPLAWVAQQATDELKVTHPMTLSAVHPARFVLQSVRSHRSFDNSWTYVQNIDLKTKSCLQPPVKGIQKYETDVVRLQAMKSQSSYSSWYFIERATIGDIRVNCTISLSSQILNSGRRDQRVHAEQKNTLFGKAIGASSHCGILQLILRHIPYVLKTEVLDLNWTWDPAHLLD